MAPPQRRRVIIIGAGPAGMSAAFHIGEHGLLLDSRSELEESHDHSLDFPLGAAGTGCVGDEDGHAVSQPRERKTVVISCSSQGEGSQDGALILVSRWQPPVLTERPRLRSPSVRMLAPLLRGELKLSARVVRVNPLDHSLELEDGARYIFDKLLSAMPLATLARLAMHELPGRIRHDAALRYWLQDHDIEVTDRATRHLHGDVEEFAAGKRVADQITMALAEKFRASKNARQQGRGLFEPRLV